MSDDSHYIGTILEDMRDQYQVLIEAVTDMQGNVAKIPKIEKDIAELKQDVRVVKAVVTDISKQQQKHEKRITTLEASSHAH
jgi:uncharacterized protein involved in exopolysaccharide biosynthesis